MMERLKVKTKGKTYIVDLHNILYCKAEGSYTEIFLVNGNVIMASVNLSTIQKRISYCMCMFRVSQSILVNMRYVVCIHHTNKELELTDSIKISFTITVREIEDKLDSLVGTV